MAVSGDDEGFERRVAQLKALAEPTRLRLVRLLRGTELTVSELTSATGQSQPGISRHLKLLGEAGLVRRRQEAAWAFYRADVPFALAPLLDELSGETLQRDDEGLVRVRAERRAAAARYFAQHAEGWDAVRRLHMPTEAIESAVRRLAGTLARARGGRLDRVVDLGTGTGRMLALLHDLYEEGVGYDASVEMLSVARARLEESAATRARVRRGDLFALPSEAHGADLVVLHQVLHFLDAPGRALAEAARLAPRGHVLIADFAPHEREELREQHAHRRLGFADEEVARWAEAAGTRLAATETLPAPQEGGLTAKLWLLGDDPAALATHQVEGARDHAPA